MHKKRDPQSQIIPPQDSNSYNLHNYRYLKSCHLPTNPQRKQEPVPNPKAVSTTGEPTLDGDNLSLGSSTSKDITIISVIIARAVNEAPSSSAAAAMQPPGSVRVPDVRVPQEQQSCVWWACAVESTSQT